MGAFLVRRQYNSPILYICIQWIARADIEAAAKRSWKNDLSLRGNFSLHGKTILPCFSSLCNCGTSLLLSIDWTRWLDHSSTTIARIQCVQLLRRLPKFIPSETSKVVCRADVLRILACRKCVTGSRPRMVKKLERAEKA